MVNLLVNLQKFCPNVDCVSHTLAFICLLQDTTIACMANEMELLRRDLRQKDDDILVLEASVSNDAYLSKSRHIVIFRCHFS